MHFPPHHSIHTQNMLIHTQNTCFYIHKYMIIHTQIHVNNWSNILLLNLFKCTMMKKLMFLLQLNLPKTTHYILDKASLKLLLKLLMNKLAHLKQLLYSFFVVGIVCHEEHHHKWWFLVIKEASTLPFIFVVSCQEIERGHQPILLILSYALHVNWINPNLHQKRRFP